MYERPSAIVIAASLVLAWPAAAAEKPTAPVQPAAQPADQRAPDAVLASVDTAKLPVAIKAGEAPAAPKKRAARVTTCRCADTSE